MSFNEALPEWLAEGTEPPLSKKTNGWQAEDKPPASYFNWLFHRTYKALLEIRDNFAVAGTANPGMNGAAAPGTSEAYSRQDHIHPSDTSRAPVNNPVFTGTGITLPADPTAPMHAVTLQLLNAKFAQATKYAP